MLFVVPLQTAIALLLAVLLNNKFLRGRNFFRTAFYFPAVTSSVATTLVFLFLFAGGGAVNSILSFFGISGPKLAGRPARRLPPGAEGLRRRLGAGLGAAHRRQPQLVGLAVRAVGPPWS